MLRSVAIAIIREQLGFRTDLEATIIRNLQYQQEVLENGLTKPWFLISELQTKRTVSGDHRVAVPDDFIAEVENMVMRYIPDDAEDESDYVALTKDDFDELIKTYKDTDSGPPEAFCLVGDYFRIFPLPDDDYLIQMMSFQRDDVLDSDIENKWLKYAPDALIGSAGLMVAQAIRDKDAIGFFTAMQVKGLRQLYGQNELREHANRTYQMGGPQ